VNRSSNGWVATALLAAVGAAACGGATSTAGSAAAGSPAPMAAPQGANPGDVRFVVGMIHHHGQALTMVELVTERSSNASIRTLAERIRVSQTDEIRLMQQWLRDHGEEAPEPSPTGMRMMHEGVEHDVLMAGMLTPAQMSELESARGGEFDRLFLRFMIQHHEGALQMVEELFAASGAANDDFIYKMASDTFADQGIEIDRMQRMLEAMSGQSP
jgi:uncharacterized protein (DUF305 family)